jgi:hypothetical protein
MIDSESTMQRQRLETQRQSIIEHLRRGWLPGEFEKLDWELTNNALEIADLWQ